MDHSQENRHGGLHKTRTLAKNATMTIEKHDLDGPGRPAATSSKQDILQDLSATLAVHAERMKLLSRAEEGLVSDSFSPYSGTPNKTSPSPGHKRTDSDQNRNEEKQAVSKIPVPQAKRKQKQEKAAVSEGNEQLSKKTDKRGKTSSGRSRIKIKDYRADYTWNRGGRLKELRIRHLARKFVHLWRHRVFGRVLPSVARKHYNRRIMLQVFSEWHDLWWSVRKEWRLMVRAECHYRYIMWNKIFYAWRLYTLYSKAHDEKLMEAENYANRKLLQKSLGCWISFVKLRKHKLQKKHEIAQIHNESVLRNAWQKWKEHLSDKQERAEMEITALQFWSYRIQAQHWLIWREKLRRQRKEYHKHSLALRHYNTTCKQKCFIAWAHFWIAKRNKKKQQEYADRLHQQHVKFRAFQTWVQRYEITQSIKLHHHRIESLARSFQLRMVFQRWRFFMALKSDEAEKWNMAMLHYRHRVLVLGFSAFHLNVVQSRLKKMRNEMAAKRRERSMTQHYWNHWLQRCENNEEFKIIHQTRQAYAHYSMILKQKCLSAWTAYTSYKFERQRQYDQADGYYYAHAMPEYLQRWRVFVFINKMKRELEEKQREFRQENLMARFFYQWYNSYEESRECRLNERMAILHYDDCLRRRFMDIWREKTAAVLQDQKKEAIAMAHYNTELCRKHLWMWKIYVRNLRQEECNTVKAVYHNKRELRRRIFTAWKHYTAVEKLKKERWNRAVKFHNKKLCIHVMMKLKANVHQSRVFRAASEERHHQKIVALLRWAFRCWHSNAISSIQEKEADNLADNFFKKKQLHKIVTIWHRYAAIHAYKKSETQQWVNETKSILNRSKLRRMFDHWKIQKDEAILTNFKVEHAICHSHRHLLQRVIDIWKDFTHTAHRKALLHKQGLWFHNTRLIAKAMLLWKQRYDDALEQSRKTDVALWHWSLVLQKKVLDGWVLFMLDKRRKKKRIEEALERRRTRMIKEGVTRWLSVASDLASLRAKLAAQQHASHAFTQHQLIQRCVIHWRLWTAQRKKQREDNSVGRQKAVIFPVQEKPASYLPLKKAPPPVFTSSPTVPVRSMGIVSLQNQTRIVGRKKPRHPSFLADSLKREGLFSSADAQDKETNTAVLNKNDGEQQKATTHIEPVGREEHVVTHKEEITLGSNKMRQQPSVQQEESLIKKNVNVELPQNGAIFNSNVKVLEWEMQEDRNFQNEPKLKLLTPADFMPSVVPDVPCREDVERLNLQGLDYSPLSTPRTIDSTSIAITTTLKSITSVPSLTSRTYDQRETNLEEKVVYIRDKLKEFETNKKRLRKLQKQRKLLSDWLKDESSATSSLDVEEVTRELAEMDVEIKFLQQLVTEQKPECAQLVEEVQRLVSQLK